jgi:hypothetical protein
MPFINCTLTDTCEEYVHGVCPAIQAGESIIDLTFFPYACPVREPYPPGKLMKIRQDLLKTAEKNKALAVRTEELRKVRRNRGGY